MTITKERNVVDVEMKVGEVPAPVVKAEQLPQGVMRGADFAEIIRALEAQSEILRRQRQVILRQTNHLDWQAYPGGRYRINDGGLSKLKGPAGLIIEDIQSWEERGEDNHGQYIDFYYSAWGRLARLGDFSPRIYALGSRSSRDLFFRQAKNRVKDLREIDLADVRKAALTNLKVNLLSELLGIKNVTADDLKAAGIEVGKVTGIEYKEGGQAESAETKDLKREVVTMAEEVAGLEGKSVEEVLAEATTYKNKEGRVTKCANLEELAKAESWRLKKAKEYLNKKLDEAQAQGGV